MFVCQLCKKTFKFQSKLDEHKNRKILCNTPKDITTCKICNITFPCLAKLERHNLSKKHIQNYNNYIEKINKTDNLHDQEHKEKIDYNGFKETYIEIISLKDITNLLSNYNVALILIKEFMNEPENIYFDSDVTINIFKF